MTTVSLPHRLSAADAMWLAQEDATQPMHGGNLFVYEGRISRGELIQWMLDRLERLPRFRQKVVFAPFGIAQASWEDDPQFDILQHITELALPAPGDDHVLGAIGGQLHAQLLDRDHPLWQMTLLHGRQDGNTAIYLKVHHALVDGPGFVELLPLLHDIDLTDVPEAVTPAVSQGPAASDPLAQLQSAVQDRLAELIQLGTDLARSARPAEALEQMQRLGGVLTSLAPEMLQMLPSMPWNGALSAARRVAWMEGSFQDIRLIRAELGGTVNDVALAVLAGGLGRYLRQHGHATEGLKLRDMVTVSVRRPEERGTMGNRVTAVIAPLFVGISDPAERLRAEQEAMDRVKEQGMAAVMDASSGLSNLIPPVVWLIASMPRPSLPPLPVQQPAMFSAITSNIPGPQRALHLGGHELVGWHPIGICMLNVGLFVVFVTYRDSFNYTLAVDPNLVPDEWVLVDHLRDAFQEMHAAAEQAQSKTTAASPPRRHR